MKLDESIIKSIEDGIEIKSGSVETSLRAASIISVEKMIEKLNEKHKSTNSKVILPKSLAINIDYYLWSLGKEPLYRSLVNFFCLILNLILKF